MSPKACFCRNLRQNATCTSFHHKEEAGGSCTLGTRKRIDLISWSQKKARCRPIREPHRQTDRERQREVCTWSTIAAAFSYLLPLVMAPTRRPTNTFTAPLSWLDNPSGPSARPLRRRVPPLLLLLGSNGSSMARSPTLRIQLLNSLSPKLLQCDLLSFKCNNVAWPSKDYMELHARKGREREGGRRGYVTLPAMRTKLMIRCTWVPNPSKTNLCGRLGARPRTPFLGGFWFHLFLRFSNLETMCYFETHRS